MIIAGLEGLFEYCIRQSNVNDIIAEKNGRQRAGFSRGVEEEQESIEQVEKDTSILYCTVLSASTRIATVKNEISWSGSEPVSFTSDTIKRVSYECTTRERLRVAAERRGATKRKEREQLL